MKGTLLSGCSWWVKTSSFLYQMELAQAHLTVVDIGIVENTDSNKRFELSRYVPVARECMSPKVAVVQCHVEITRKKSSLLTLDLSSRKRQRAAVVNVCCRPVTHSVAA